MPKYIVTIPGNSQGMFRFQWSGRVEAADRAEATARARAKMKEDGFKYRGRPVVEEIRTYAVTICARSDGRRRETFFVEAIDERRALWSLRLNESVQRLLYPYVSLRAADVVKIEVKS